MGYEELLGNINSSKPEYEYLYLFKSKHDNPLLHPVPYDEDEKMKANEASVDALLHKKIAEFKSCNYNLLLLAELYNYF